MQKYQKLLKQVVTYGVVGVITLGIDVSVTTTLYHLAHLPPYLASAGGFLSGFFFSFPMNRKRVFHHSQHDRFSLKLQVSLFLALSLFNLLATSFIVELLVVHGVLRIAFAKLFVTALIAVWNFTLFKTVIFSKLPTADIERLSVQ